MTSGRIHKTEGIILKRKNTGETDRIVTIFTEEYGKITCIAKGVRKITSRRSGHIEVFHRVALTLHDGSQLAHLTEAQTIDSHQTLSSDIMNVSYAYYACELIDALTPERQKHGDVYGLLRDVLSEITTCHTNRKRTKVVTEFAHNVLRILGFLSPEKILTPDKITPYVENVIERKLKVPRVMRLLG